MNLPDVGGEPTKRAVSAVHASTRCFHSNTCSISPQFNALDDSFQHNVAGALDVDFSEYLDAREVRGASRAEGGAGQRTMPIMQCTRSSPQTDRIRNTGILFECNMVENTPLKAAAQRGGRALRRQAAGGKGRCATQRAPERACALCATHY